MTVFSIDQVANDELAELFYVEQEEPEDREWPEQDPFGDPPIDDLTPVDLTYAPSEAQTQLAVAAEEFAELEHIPAVSHTEIVSAAHSVVDAAVELIRLLASE